METSGDVPDTIPSTTVVAVQHGTVPRHPILSVQNLKVYFDARGHSVHAVDGVTFTLDQGEVFGVVGESGCGKSAMLRSLIGLLPAGSVHTEGHVYYGDRDLLGLSERALRGIRGADIAMIFQDPMTYLNPVLRVDEQIKEALRQHTSLGRAGRHKRAIELMRLVGIPLPDRRLREYPHQFSGGMRQRVLIAIALACGPRILLADEPTTALDVTIQDQILKLLLRLRRELGMSIILVSHDLGVIVQTCERVAVMYAGQIVEMAPVRQLIRNPRHPYTVGLLNSLPDVTSSGRYLQPISGAPPSLIDPPSGCRFYDRCSLRTDECRTWQTELLEIESGHVTRCWRHEQVEASGV
jgi:peptide/nickel transport system ATP-binding protein/oligopeptide transport system ATP-binding protein